MSALTGRPGRIAARFPDDRRNAYGGITATLEDSDRPIGGPFTNWRVNVEDAPPWAECDRLGWRQSTIPPAASSGQSLLVWHFVALHQAQSHAAGMTAFKGQTAHLKRNLEYRRILR